MAEVAEPVRDALRGCGDGKLPWPLVLTGPAGTGKTCAALALADYVRGPSILYPASEMADRLAAAKCGRLVEWTFARGEDTRVDPLLLWREWCEYDLCIIDDLGQRANVTDTGYEAIKAALDAREGRPVIVTTNTDLDGIARSYDDRIASRLASGTAVELEDGDRRMNAAEETTP